MNIALVAAQIFVQLHTDANFAERVHSSNEPYRTMHAFCNVPEAREIIDGSPQYCKLIDILEELVCADDEQVIPQPESDTISFSFDEDWPSALRLQALTDTKRPSLGLKTFNQMMSEAGVPRRTSSFQEVDDGLPWHWYAANDSKFN